MNLSNPGLNETPYRQFGQELRRTFRAQDSKAPLDQWVLDCKIVLDDNPFAFTRHEYLWLPYNDDYPYQVEMKAAQLGLTTKAALRSIHGAVIGKYPRGILYLFPNKSDVTDFSKGRITPLIEENQDSIAQWIADTDTANLKKIAKSFLYLRGMQSRIGLKSVPVDFIVFDELDEAPQSRIDMALERMGHSEMKEWLMLSNPTLPDFGIDKAFKTSDQRYWHLKCEHCGESTCLEETFPSCLLELGDGRVIRACKKCKAELNPSIGEWVKKRLDPDLPHGYHYSQLFSHFVSPKEILKKFRTTDNLTDFYNLKIGIPWVEARARISLEAVYARCSDYGMGEMDGGPCSMGVDQGKDLHVTIGKLDPDRAGKIVYLGIHKEWADLNNLFRRFHVYRCVIDGNPDQDSARNFAKSFPGKVFLSFYNEKQKGSYKWDEKNWTVSSNRTESLDASAAQILGRAEDGKGASQVILPKKCQMVEEFAQHLHSVAKRLEEDEETGSKRYIYVKLNPDHFRHSFNYECMARSFFADLAFPELLQ